MDFGKAIEALKEGKMVTRLAWEWEGKFVFMQAPAIILIEVVPKMQSLPPLVKLEFMKRFEEDELLSIYYTNQLAVVDEYNYISGYSPSTEDALAADWFIKD